MPISIVSTQVGSCYTRGRHVCQLRCWVDLLICLGTCHGTMGAQAKKQGVDPWWASRSGMLLFHIVVANVNEVRKYSILEEGILAKFVSKKSWLEIQSNNFFAHATRRDCVARFAKSFCLSKMKQLRFVTLLLLVGGFLTVLLVHRSRVKYTTQLEEQRVRGERTFSSGNHNPDIKKSDADSGGSTSAKSQKNRDDRNQRENRNQNEAQDHGQGWGRQGQDQFHGQDQFPGTYKNTAINVSFE